MNRLRIPLLAVVTSLVVAMTAVLGAPSGSAVTKPPSGTLVLASGSGAPGISVVCADVSPSSTGPASNSSDSRTRASSR